MSNEETQTNDEQKWSGPSCCGPSASNINMKEVMKNCSQMMKMCRTEWSAPSAKESKSDSEPTSL